MIQQNKIENVSRVKANDERRDSPRIPLKLQVRDKGLENGQWEAREGDISLGGLYWQGVTPAHSVEFDVRFHLPGVEQEIQGHAEIIRLTTADSVVHFHARFVDLDTASELAIAKRIDSWMAGAD